MKRIIYLFTICVIYFSAKAQTSCNFNVNVEYNQRIENGYLVIEGYIQKTSGSDFILGSTNFVGQITIPYGYLDLNDKILHYNFSEIQIGSANVLWSSNPNATGYFFNFSPLNSSCSPNSNIQNGYLITSTKKKLFRVDVKILQPCFFSQIIPSDGVAMNACVGENTTYQTYSFKHCVNYITNPLTNTITLNTPSVSGPSTSISGTEITFNAASGNLGYNTQFNWSVPSDWQILSGQGTSEILVRVGTSSGTVSVYETIGTCNTNTTSHNVSVNSCNSSTPTAFNPNVIAINSTSATIAWNGVADYYKVRYKLASASTFINIDIPGSEHTFTFTGLEPNKYYEYLVIPANVCTNASDIIGTSTGTHFFSTDFADGVTSTDPCAKPIGVFISNITEHSAIINWSDEMSSDIYKVWVYNTDKQKNVYVGTTVTHSISVTNLNEQGTQAGTKHSVTLAPFCDGLYQSATSNRFFLYSADITGSSSRLAPETKLAEQELTNFTASIFPNPASQSATIEIESDEETLSTITVMDITGRVVYNIATNLTLGNNKVQLQLEQLNQGIYFVEISNSTAKKTLRLIKE